MPNKNYFAQLSPSQKAELFLIYTSNGMYNLQEIMNHYNSEMERAYSSTDKDMVARMHDVNAPYLLDEEGNKMTHRMASGEGYVFPTIQRNENGDLENYEDTEDWGAQRAIDRGDTLQFKLPSLADYFSKNYKTHLDNPNMFDMGGDKDGDKDNVQLYYNPSMGDIGVNFNVERTVEPLHVDTPYTPDDFFERWYPNRMQQVQNNMATVNRMRSRLFPDRKAGKEAPQFVNSMLRNAKLVGEYTLLHPGYSAQEKYFRFPNALKDSVARAALNDGVRAKNRILGKEIKVDYPDDDLRWEGFGTNGFSKTSYPHLIFYTNADPNDRTIVHERTHPLRPELGSILGKDYMVYPWLSGEAWNPMEYKIATMSNQLKTTEKGQNLDQREANYYFSAEEINARMNAIREQQNLNPKHKITKEDLQDIKKNASREDRNGFLDLIDDDSLLRLFNEVAGANESIDMSNIASNGGMLIRRFDMGGDKKQYNIFEDKNSFDARDKHRKSLDEFIKNNPELYGISTSDFADFLSQIAGLESSYKSDAGKGMTYSGYYGLKGGRDLNENAQHKAAFKHLKKLFNESIVKDDIDRGVKLGYTPSQILAKYWNQGNRVTNYLWNNIDNTDGLGTKISDYGNNITVDMDYSNYLDDAITDDYIIINNSKSMSNAIKRARNPKMNYSDRQNHILNLNGTKDKNGRIIPLDATKVHVGDTLWLKK